MSFTVASENCPSSLQMGTWSAACSQHDDDDESQSRTNLGPSKSLSPRNTWPLTTKPPATVPTPSTENASSIMTRAFCWHCHTNNTWQHSTSTITSSAQRTLDAAFVQSLCLRRVAKKALRMSRPNTTVAGSVSGTCRSAPLHSGQQSLQQRRYHTRALPRPVTELQRNTGVTILLISPDDSWATSLCDHQRERGSHH